MVTCLVTFRVAFLTRDGRYCLAFRCNLQLLCASLSLCFLLLFTFTNESSRRTCFNLTHARANVDARVIAFLGTNDHPRDAIAVRQGGGLMAPSEMGKLAKGGEL